MTAERTNLLKSITDHHWSLFIYEMFIFFCCLLGGQHWVCVCSMDTDPRIAKDALHQFIRKPYVVCLCVLVWLWSSCVYGGFPGTQRCSGLMDGPPCFHASCWQQVNNHRITVTNTQLYIGRQVGRLKDSGTLWLLMGERNEVKGRESGEWQW